jgi:hypothetical protein
MTAQQCQERDRGEAPRYFLRLDRPDARRDRGAMGQLNIEAINPVIVSGWGSLLWAFRGVEWEVTCGLCRTRFRSLAYLFASSIVCPACGTRNLVSNAGWLWRPLGPRRR